MPVNIHLEEYGATSTKAFLNSGETLRARVVMKQELDRLTKELFMADDKANKKAMACKWERTYSVYLKVGGSPMANTPLQVIANPT